MSIKLVAVDLDGTLLDSNKKTPDDFHQWVIEHPEIMTVIATGRQYYRICREFCEISDKLTFVAENGTMVVHDNMVLYQNEIAPDACRAFARVVEPQEHRHLVVCGVNSAYMTHVEPKVLDDIMMYFERLEIVDSYEEAFEKDKMIKLSIYDEDSHTSEILEEYVDLADLSVVAGSPEWVDIFNRDANKGKGIEVLQKHFGISRSECMAFGDFMNDYEMMLACEESYCMQNGCDEIKAIAKHITASNDKDGVMKVLRTL